MRHIDGKLKNPALRVCKELPHGVLEQEKSSFRDYRIARGFADGEYKHFYFCPKCEGWVEGYPTSYRTNTLAPLSGRSGRVEDCERCGYELDFIGVVS